MCAPPPRSGHAVIAAGAVAGASALLRLRGTSPVKVIPVRSRGRAAWAVPTTYGGGIVAGDAIRIEVDVAAGARLMLTTQASTKLYRSEGAEARQDIAVRVGDGGLLLSLPDPLCPFAGSRYRQHAAIDLDDGASLVWLDAVSAGRSARGEAWAMAALDVGLRIDRRGRPLAIDRWRLGPAAAPGMADVAVLATVVAAGPLTAAVRAAMLAAGTGTADGGAEILSTAHALPTAADAVILRLAARSAEAAHRFLRSTLSACAELADADPFAGR